ncbi:hypothetical protein COV56_02745 [Candidatus Kuenenbacteria bacterium CG11_big_fil_rev_8_21_14_0_20_37_9]|uniref:DUF5666 domain-containing protein n=2 Tax=Candidatus Kueneniibacteriota TaxID=1752740 RepID=A0A2M6XT61_9BACT|nr:MAG: hypothetical protein AUJ29_00015 [Candidatus Kuenenbacteria bacterium CG1_02_38_13]PIR05429.1 MAG: hypothetical protein COV56_02745 [Candidatus Kuenenbacteria bacterium CG11_big_fil_rev_8_21_14_0_20_37_9]PIU10822.1 MAG: hypothetical protein COT27_01145 [Candidatus Kuenenbacteria bacterium CG08_land_8_20_14_0_20_37_23]
MWQPNALSDKIKKILIIALFLIIIVISASLIINSTKTENDNINIIGADEKETPVPSDGLPKVFYSYIGTISEINTASFIIKAEKIKNYLASDAIITINVDDETTYSKTIIPREINDNGNINFERKNINFNDLKVNDEVIAISYENVKDKKEFLAKQIEIQIIE